ncbi:MAG: AEC family transporter [Candidatus Omnitrophota bacterium]
MNFLSSFTHVLFVMLEIFFTAMWGFIFYRRNLLTSEALKGLSNLTINLFLPCLVFSHLINNFSFNSYQHWWIYPLLGIIVSVVGALVAGFFSLFHKDFLEKREFVSLIAFQNCGYLPLVIVSRIFSAPLSEELFVNIFLFIQGFNLIFWSMGVSFLGGEKPRGLRLRSFVNTPFLSLVLSLIIISLGMRELIPKGIMQATQSIGNCTLPVALVTLGAVLGAGSGKVNNLKRLFFEVALSKMVVIPLLMLIFIIVVKLPKAMALVLLLEAAMPSAVTLSVVSFNQNSRFGFISQGVLLTHFLAIFTVPLLLGLFSLFVK